MAEMEQYLTLGLAEETSHQHPPNVREISTCGRFRSCRTLRIFCVG